MNQQKSLLSNMTLMLMIPFMTMITTALMLSAVTAQEQSAPAGEMFAARPRIDVPVSLSLEEARVMIDAAVALVKAEKGRAAIAVVDYNGNLISMDSMDGNSRFWARFAVGKAVGAVALTGGHSRVGGAGQDEPRAVPKRVEYAGGRDPTDPRGHAADHR